MNLFINARFLTQPVTGVQRYGIECSRQIKALYPAVTFLCPANVVNRAVADELGAVVIGRHTGHRWEQVDLPAYLSGHKEARLINLANTGPLLFRNNYTVIHDLAFYHHPGWNSRVFSAWYNFLLPRLARRSRHVFTVSETIKQELTDIYKLPPAKVTVTYNGIGKRMLRMGIQAWPKERIILSVGTFSLRKNQHTLVKAFLQSSIKDAYTLVLAGDRNKIFAESGISEAMAGDNIKIYEHLSDDDLIDLYRRAEVLVSLSNYEGFGIPVLEGLYFGCKVLCSDIAVYRELFSEYAVFCNQGDVQNVAGQLAAATQSSPIDKESITLLPEKYSYRKAAEEILSVITASKHN